MCLYPQLIKNRKYTSTKKNGGNIPPITDQRTRYVPIGCQKCIECRKQKAREWQVRLLEDIKTNTNGKFITLTFNNESIKELYNDIRTTEGKVSDTNRPNKKPKTDYDLDNAIATMATRKFLERWRKQYKTSLRHWLVTELGHNGTENIHIHGIIWTNEPLNKVEKIWKYGFMWKGKETQSGKIINYVNQRTVGYITKYVHKTDAKHTQYKSKILTSPGIGNNYTKTPDSKNNNYNGKNTIESYRTKTGHKISLPIYWRNKIYTEKERESLWIHRLDKETRWVRGEKVSIKNGEEQYKKLLKWHQDRNKEMGYGDGTKNWALLKYEKQRRQMMQEKRIKSA